MTQADQDLLTLATLSLFFVDGAPAVVSDFERELLFTALDRFNSYPAGFAFTEAERIALGDLLDGLIAAEKKAAA